jgi:hypothetical protein
MRSSPYAVPGSGRLVEHARIALYFATATHDPPVMYASLVC